MLVPASLLTTLLDERDRGIPKDRPLMAASQFGQIRPHRLGDAPDVLDAHLPLNFLLIYIFSLKSINKILVFLCIDLHRSYLNRRQSFGSILPFLLRLRNVDRGQRWLLRSQDADKCVLRCRTVKYRVALLLI